jgi:hypothetical protein
VKFEKSSLFLIIFPVMKADPVIIQADLSYTPHVFKALCLNVFIPGIFRVPIKVIVIDGKLRVLIHDVWGSWPAFVAHADRRVMDFRWRP